ncbi:bifunctional folylpolyglutamate synthase/dihydrofolate synthase [candidate division WOR-3 bacterium]|nr:bifunctional folylpolyglutamate synthase/dihydrofolate synthase [candidate division WOR-3 bacterium]
MNKKSQDFLHSLIDYEKTPGYDYDLDAYKNFLDHFGAPHKQLSNVILIAGTKGKGATAAILAACLMSNGYRVGLYTSPHLSAMNERISVNNRNISDTDFDRLVAKVKPVIKKKTGARSFFEALTTIAFLYFLEQRVDFTVLEVGLGGRLDATNASEPLLSVITRVGYDHMNLLGTRLSQIAAEKAGIIRHNGALVTIHQRPAVERILRKVARERWSTVVFAEEQHRVKTLSQTMDGTKIRVRGKTGDFETFLPLAGPHQIENLIIALAVLSELRRDGVRIRTEAVKQGVQQTVLRGRFEIVSRRPLVIFDCAHNEDSFKALERNIEIHKVRTFDLVFGTNRDKDIRYFLQHICPRARQVLIVKADHPRAMEPCDLVPKARKYQKRATTARSVQTALDLLSRAKEKPVAIIVTGSFYLWQKKWAK